MSVDGVVSRQAVVFRWSYFVEVERCGPRNAKENARMAGLRISGFADFWVRVM